jgi:hypothetical protein
MRFQSFFLLITGQPLDLASPENACVKVPTFLSANPSAGPYASSRSASSCRRASLCEEVCSFLAADLHVPPHELEWWEQDAQRKQTRIISVDLLTQSQFKLVAPAARPKPARAAANSLTMLRPEEISTSAPSSCSRRSRSAAIAVPHDSRSQCPNSTPGSTNWTPRDASPLPNQWPLNRPRGQGYGCEGVCHANVTQAYWVSKISRPLAAWMGRAFPGYNFANAAT